MDHYQTKKRKLLVAWSLHRFVAPNVFAFVVSLLFYAIGLALSDHASSEPLARSGSAATAMLVLFTVYDFRQHISDSQERSEDLFQRITAGFPMTGKDSFASAREKLAANSDRANKINIWINAVGLAIATVVWGFGDLAKCYLWW